MEDLQAAARDVKAQEILGLHQWISAIKDLDNWWITQWKRVTEAVEEVMHSNKKPFSSSSQYANTADKNSALSSSSANTTTSTVLCDFPPKLTDKERCLLMEHAGCLKCQEFYTGHHAHQCQITISGKNYKTLTLQDANHAKVQQNSKMSSNSKLNTVATVSDASTSNDTEDFVAAVFLSLSSNVIGNGSYSEGSDNSFTSVSSPPHTKSKHLIWNCMLPWLVHQLIFQWPNPPLSTMAATWCLYTPML